MKRSRIRTGADEVRAWVRKLHLGNPYAKAILMAAANYANEDAIAYPGIETLASDTDIAENTVSARLRWCESIGAIKVTRAYLDDNGNRMRDSRGKPTSSDIRFMIDVDPDTISVNAEKLSTPRAPRGFARKSAGEPDAVSPSPHEGLNPELDFGVSPSTAPQQPLMRADPKKKEGEDSEAIASGAAAPLVAYTDARHALFGEGVPILESLGVATRQARSMIGRWLKDTRDDASAVLGAIQRARDHRVVDPIPWITQGLRTNAEQRNDSTRPRPGSFLAGIASVAASLDRRGGMAAPAAPDVPSGGLDTVGTRARDG